MHEQPRHARCQRANERHAAFRKLGLNCNRRYKPGTDPQDMSCKLRQLNATTLCFLKKLRCALLYSAAAACQQGTDLLLPRRPAMRPPLRASQLCPAASWMRPCMLPQSARVHRPSPTLPLSCASCRCITVALMDGTRLCMTCKPLSDAQEPESSALVVRLRTAMSENAAGGGPAKETRCDVLVIHKVSSVLRRTALPTARDSRRWHTHQTMHVLLGEGLPHDAWAQSHAG